MSKKPLHLVGFVATAAELEQRVRALDEAIQALRADVENAPVTRKLDAGWRFEFDDFLRRWALDRNNYVDVVLFASTGKLDDYTLSYRYWARDFTNKSGIRPTLPLERATKSVKPVLAGIIPDEVWWILAGGMALWVLRSSR